MVFENTHCYNINGYDFDLRLGSRIKEIGNHKGNYYERVWRVVSISNYWYELIWENKNDFTFYIPPFYTMFRNHFVCFDEGYFPTNEIWRTIVMPNIIFNTRNEHF